MANQNLGLAKMVKNDEFYTRRQDIARELSAYIDFDPEVFRDKVIHLPCDDPRSSNFTAYFIEHFEQLGIRRLISTGYAVHGAKGTLLDIERGSAAALDTTTNGPSWRYLEGDGDFRSNESTELRDEADIVITNPPFSLFREFLAWIMEARKNFVIIGNKNAITYKEVFPLIRDDKIWLGATPMGTDMLFGLSASVASDIVVSGRERSAWRRVNGEVFARASCVWFSNIEHARRHQPLVLMTEADNIKFSKHKNVHGVGYHPYENLDGIEVPFTDAIPSDFRGVMGVPISFLDKYNPDQFEIVGLNRHCDYPGLSKTFVEDYFASGQTAEIWEGHPDLGFYDADGRPTLPYRRVLIRHRR